MALRILEINKLGRVLVDFSFFFSIGPLFFFLLLSRRTGRKKFAWDVCKKIGRWPTACFYRATVRSCIVPVRLFPEILRQIMTYRSFIQRG